MKEKEIRQEYLTGERALFQGADLIIYDSIFADGESPLIGANRQNWNNYLGSKGGLNLLLGLSIIIVLVFEVKMMYNIAICDDEQDFVAELE